MFGIVGIVVILVMVFGGYTIHGGKMGPIIEALPFEMIMIGGQPSARFWCPMILRRSNTPSRTWVRSSKG